MDWTHDLYSDDERGEFAGNILVSLAALFPPAVGERISTRAPITTQWRLMVRTLKHGPVGHFIWTETRVLTLLQDVFEDVFRGYPRDERYPDIFNEEYRNGLPLVCVGDASDPRVTIWLAAPKKPWWKCW